MKNILWLLIFCLCGGLAAMPKLEAPSGAMDFLNAKGLNSLATERWNDLSGREHAHAFTVAGSLGYEIAGDIASALMQAKESGVGFNEFKKSMRNNPQISKWLGDIVDSKGLEGKKAAAYKAWRERIIYTTNNRTAAAAGRYRSQLKAAALRPYFRYKQEQRKNKRASHSGYHNLVVHSGDSFWDTHYPPNGWNCGCYVQSVSLSEAKRLGITSAKVVNEAVGNNPIDKSWSYNAGLEMLAPNFSQYENLRELDALKKIKNDYKVRMQESQLSKGEFKTLANKVDAKDYRALGINYEVGLLSAKVQKRFDAAKINVDMKVMSTDRQLVHAQADKNAKQKLAKKDLGKLYKVLSDPSRVYEEIRPDYPHKGRVFHFVRDLNKDEVIRVVLRQQESKSLQLVTYGRVPKQGENKGGQLKEIS